MLKVPKCMLCKRYREIEGKEVCEAFPEGIPDDVIWEDAEKECNNGIGFKEE